MIPVKSEEMKRIEMFWMWFLNRLFKEALGDRAFNGIWNKSSALPWVGIWKPSYGVAILVQDQIVRTDKDIILSGLNSSREE